MESSPTKSTWRQPETESNILPRSFNLNDFIEKLNTSSNEYYTKIFIDRNEIIMPAISLHFEIQELNY